MVRRILLATLATVATLTIAGGAYVRVAPMGPADWHVDPAAARRTGRPNDWLVATGGDAPPVAVPLPPAAAMARLDAVAMSEPGTTRLAGTPGAGFVTYVQRSRLMGFPDAVSVRAVPEGDGSTVSIWSRARFGQSDLGVNRARVSRWLGVAGF